VIANETEHVSEKESPLTLINVTPEKKPSIGLTPVQDRLYKLRLSSGLRPSPQLQDTMRFEKEEVRRRLFEEDEEIKGDRLEAGPSIREHTRPFASRTYDQRNNDSFPL